MTFREEMAMWEVALSEAPGDWRLHLVFADWSEENGLLERADFHRHFAMVKRQEGRQQALGACKRQVYEAGASGRPEQQEGWGWESFLLYGSFYDTKKSTVLDGADAAWRDGWTPYLYDFLHLSLKSPLVSV